MMRPNVNVIDKYHVKHKIYISYHFINVIASNSTGHINVC